MIKPENTVLYEHSQEGMDAVHEGNADINSGGIRRKGEKAGAFIEHAKPAYFTLADLMAEYDSRLLLSSEAYSDQLSEFATSIGLSIERIQQMHARRALSIDGLRAIKRIAWLNNATTERTYLLTQEGFNQTLLDIENAISEIKGIEYFIKTSRAIELRKEARNHYDQLGNFVEKVLIDPSYTVASSTIDEGIGGAISFIHELIEGSDAGVIDRSFTASVISVLLPSLAYAARLYVIKYYYEKGILRPRYQKWVNEIDRLAFRSSLRNSIEYYVRTKTDIPFRDVMKLNRLITQNLQHLVDSMEINEEYLAGNDLNDVIQDSKQYRSIIESGGFLLDSAHPTCFMRNEQMVCIRKTT